MVSYWCNIVVRWNLGDLLGWVLMLDMLDWVGLGCCWVVNLFVCLFVCVSLVVMS